MKTMYKKLSLLPLLLFAFFGMSLFAHAQYYPYTTNDFYTTSYGSYNLHNNNCVIMQTYPYTYNCNNYTNSYNNSYTYTNGCYTYYYNAYTRQSTIISYNCQQTYVQPITYTYTYPAQYQNYYTQPNYVYQYSHGSWYRPQYYNQMNYGNYGYTNTNYYNSYSNNCYWQNGYQICY